jgi:hypothetical protein
MTYSGLESVIIRHEAQCLIPYAVACSRSAHLERGQCYQLSTAAISGIAIPLWQKCAFAPRATPDLSWARNAFWD